VVLVETFLLLPAGMMLLGETCQPVERNPFAAPGHDVITEATKQLVHLAGNQLSA
jgi:hypothetical protein